ncbi:MULTISPECIES: aminoglycoside 6-adenylyltransferase [Blautia]|uniref:aminoglycoside 6-adenylyltransferase n=1 Tax=Blautia TaxID=572511 RepID=UPI00338DC646
MAKGMVRDQMPYARMYHQVVHVELEKMAEWYIAAEHDFSVSTGMPEKRIMMLHK